jgi:HAD superfamily hydrolase (TIGR01549 family)
MRVVVAKNYKYILFDWDGTLVRTLDVWRNALLYSLDLHGYEIDPSDIGANYVHFADLAPDLGIDRAEAVKSIISTAQQQVRNTEDLAELYDGVASMLKQLRAANKRIAIVTTSTHQQVDHKLHTWNIEHLVDAVICGEDVVAQKPAAEHLQLAMQLLDATLSETIMIGDSPNDLVGARNTGIDSALYFPPGHKTFYDLAELRKLKPTFIVDSFAELTLKLA